MQRQLAPPPHKLLHTHFFVPCLRLLAITAIIFSQVAAVFPLPAPVRAAPAQTVTQSLDVCAAPTHVPGPEDGPRLFMPVISNSKGTTSFMVASTNQTLGMRAAFVHGPNLETAQAYLAMLTTAGVATTLLPVAQVENANFGKCDLIIVASDSGKWTNASARNAVVNSQAGVVAQGDSGLNFLEAAGLTTGLARGGDDATAVEAVLRGLDAYQFPTQIENAATANLTLYNAPVAAAWLTIPTPLPTGVEIGRLPGTQNHPLLQLGGRFTLWGFNGAPAQMTTTGQALFLNLLAFQQQELFLPLQSRSFVPAPGVDPALLSALAATSLPQLHAYVQYYPEGGTDCSAVTVATPQTITPVQYLYGTTYFGTVPKTFDPASLAAQPCVRWVGYIPPADKVTAKVLAENFAEWALTAEGIKLLVTFFDDVSDATAEQILQDHAKSFARQGNHIYRAIVPQAQITTLVTDDRVKWMEEGPPPPAPTNDNTRMLMHVEEVQQAVPSMGTLSYRGLDGSGVVVGIFDDGFDITHPDFAGRILSSSGEQKFHGTHVAGILGGSGANSASQGFGDFQLRGMAPAVQMIFDGDDLTPDDYTTYINTNGMRLANASLKLSECGGDYDVNMQLFDGLLRGDLQDNNAQSIPPHTMVAAAGNEGSAKQYCPGHIGFHSVFNVGKNILLVGGVLANGSNIIASISSRGPTADGRIKPDVMAVFDTRSTGLGGSYASTSGTSMASPAAAGVAALVLQQYGMTYGKDPRPASLRGLLIHHATDLVNEPGTAPYTPLNYWEEPDTGGSLIYHQGPDFSTGYGMVHAARTVAGAAAYNVIEADLANDTAVDEYTFQVIDGRSEVKVTLVWDDPAGDPSLNETASQLVNDLDLVLIDPQGGMHYPYVLNPLPLDGNFGMDDVNPAYRAVDHRNNVEQVVVRVGDVPNNAWQGTWTARVRATDMPEGPQGYSLIGEWRRINIVGSYPIDGGYNQEPEAIIVPVQVRNPHLNPQGAAAYPSPEEWQVYFAQSGGTLEAGVVQTAWGPVGDQVYLVVRPPNTLAANTPYHMVVYLRHPYQRHQHTSDTMQPVAVDLVENAIIFDDQPRPPVDEMIVADNSGSMSAYGKLGAAQNAARAFIDRREANDQIGVATFASNATTLMELTEVVNNAALNSAKLAVANMSASGNTAMGQGLLEGKDELDTKGAAGNSRHIVLLSDGLENITPCWNTEEGHENCIGAASVQPDFVSDGGCPAIQVDTVVIGPDNANWVELLADVAEKTCGQPYTVTTNEEDAAAAMMPDAAAAEGEGYFATQLANNLADIYLDISDNNVRRQRLVERGRFFFFNLPDVDTQSFEIEPGLDEVDIVVNWYNETNGVKAALLRPSGEEVIELDSDARIRRDITHVVYTIQNPTAGTWKVEIGSAAPQEYIVTVSANSPTQMLVTLGLEPEQRVPGAMLPIYVVMSDRQGVVKDGTVDLKIRIPGGSVVELAASDDGEGGDQAAGDGVYTALYQLPHAGGYQIKAIGAGTNNDGVAFTRFAQRHLWAKAQPLALYVYDTDQETGEAYQTLLEQQGFGVQLVQMAQIEATDFAAADLVLIAHETGIAPNWGTPAQLNHIKDNAARVIGIGTGGHAFFAAIGANMGAGSGVKKNVVEISRWDNTHPIWNTPVDLTSGITLKLFPAAGGSGLALELGAGFDALAGDGVNSTPIWIAREGMQYLYWGLDSGPNAMTVEARALFANVAWLMVE